MQNSNYTIAFVTETWEPEINGVAKTTAYIVKNLLKRGVKVQLIRPKQGDNTRHELIDEYQRAGFKLPFYKEVRLGLPQGRFLFKLWNTHRPDAVIIVTEGMLGLSGLKTARKLGIPVISEFHTNFDQYSLHYNAKFLHGLVKEYLRWFHNKSDKTLVATEQFRQQLQADNFRRLEVLPRGVDTQLFNPSHRSQQLREKWYLLPEQLAFIFVGRLAPEKNVGLAIQAFREAQKHSPDAKMIIVGDGPLRKSLQSSHPDIIFSGMQTGQALARHYASADIFLSASMSETFGNTLLEAMASRLATISFDYAATKKHVIHNSNGIAIPFNDSVKFIQETIALSHNRSLKTRLATNARATTLPLSWSSISNQYEHIIEHLIINGGHEDARFATTT